MSPTVELLWPLLFIIIIIATAATTTSTTIITVTYYIIKVLIHFSQKWNKFHWNKRKHALRSRVCDTSQLLMNSCGFLANPRKKSRFIFSWLMVSTVSWICSNKINCLPSLPAAAQLGLPLDLTAIDSSQSADKPSSRSTNTTSAKCRRLRQHLSPQLPWT